MRTLTALLDRLASKAAIAVAAAFTLCGTAYADPAVYVAFGRDPGHDINKYEIGLN